MATMPQFPPPRMAPNVPTAPQAAPPSPDVGQLLQILIQLVQNQNALVQQQGQQAPQSTGPPRGADPPGLQQGSPVPKLDEKYFRRCVVFNNKAEQWREWQVHFLAAVREESSQLVDVMKGSELREQAIDLDDMHPAVEESRRLCTTVCSAWLLVRPSRSSSRRTGMALKLGGYCLDGTTQQRQLPAWP